MKINHPKSSVDEEQAQDLELARRLVKTIKAGGPGTYFLKRLSAQILDYISSELPQPMVSVYIDKNNKISIIAKYPKDYSNSINKYRVEDYISGAKSKIIHKWSESQNEITTLTTYYSIEGDTEQILRLLLSKNSPITYKFPVLFSISIFKGIVTDKNGKKFKLNITNGGNIETA